jgi:hypothetical protein
MTFSGTLSTRAEQDLHFVVQFKGSVELENIASLYVPSQSWG